MLDKSVFDKFFLFGDKVVFKGGKMFSFDNSLVVVAESSLPFENIAINTSSLKTVLKSATDKSVAVEQHENSIRIKGRKFECDILNVEFDDISDIINSINDELFQDLPDGFFEKLKTSIEFCSKDEGDFLNCVKFDGSKIVSSDDIRICVTDFDIPIVGLLPSKSLAKILSLGITSFYDSDLYVWFKDKIGVVFGVMKFDAYDEYPDVDGYFVFETKEFTVNDDIINALSMGLAFNQNDVYSMRSVLKVAGGKLFLKSENDEGKIESKCTSIHFDGDFEFIINPKFFIGFIEKSKKIFIGVDRGMVVVDDTKILMSFVRS